MVQVCGRQLWCGGVLSCVWGGCRTLLFGTASSSKNFPPRRRSLEGMKTSKPNDLRMHLSRLACCGLRVPHAVWSPTLCPQPLCVTRWGDCSILSLASSRLNNPSILASHSKRDAGVEGLFNHELGLFSTWRRFCFLQKKLKAMI